MAERWVEASRHIHKEGEPEESVLLVNMANVCSVRVNQWNAQLTTLTFVGGGEIDALDPPEHFLPDSPKTFKR
jgi:hypothetical protein